MEFAGKGNRKPQLDIPIELIYLDKDNPRLVPYIQDENDPTQVDLITVLYENFDTESVAMSMVANGYFDEEPIIVVPNELPQNFDYDDFNSVDELTQGIAKLIEEGKVTFTVVEGNRRVSTIKLLLEKSLRETLKIDGYYPKVDDAEIAKDISRIPCIIYPKRNDVSSYLGVRHIAGLLKWEAFAKAAYVAETIKQEAENGLSISQAVDKVQKVVGDRSDTLRKQFITYNLFQEAKHDINFPVKPILDKFSLLTVMYNSPAIREYINVKAYSQVDFTNRIVPTEKFSEFEEVLSWVFGNEDKGIKPVLTDSRKITDTLSYVVKSPDAVEYLRKYQDLDGAFDRTSGERDYLSKNLTKAARAIQTSLQFAFKYKGDTDLLKQVDELEQLIDVLKSNLSR